MISLLVPTFNEQEAIAKTIEEAHAILTNMGEEFEIVVINDGSNDNTKQILEGVSLPNVRIIHQPRNRGYGASLKAGIRSSSGAIIAITDADGTYPIHELKTLRRVMQETDADMVIGARTKKGVQIPWVRKPAKAVVALLANWLTGIHIPDNNSGLRMFKRSLAEQFMHLYPQGFSFTLTITLAALTNDYRVEFIPIDYAKREGTSSLSSGMNGIKNFAYFLGLIIRIITYFRPLRFFIWPSALLFFFGCILTGLTIWKDQNISDAGMLLLLTGIQVGLFGLLADVVVRSRKG